MTYYDAISELQQRGFAALKVAQSTQIAALSATRDLAKAFAAPTSAMLTVPSTLVEARKLSTSFAFALLEQQVAYTKEITDVLTEPLRPAVSSAQPSPPALEPTLNLVTETTAAEGAAETPTAQTISDPVALPAVVAAAQPEIEPIAARSVDPAPESSVEPTSPAAADTVIESAGEPAVLLSTDASAEHDIHSLALLSSEQTGELASILTAPPNEDPIAEHVSESPAALAVEALSEPVFAPAAAAEPSVDSIAESVAPIVEPIVEPVAQLPVAVRAEIEAAIVPNAHASSAKSSATPKMPTLPSVSGSTDEGSRIQKPVPASSKNAAAKPKKGASPGKPQQPKRGPKRK